MFRAISARWKKVDFRESRSNCRILNSVVCRCVCVEFVRYDEQSLTNLINPDFFKAYFFFFIARYTKLEILLKHR
jgi:hypothetical protein